MTLIGPGNHDTGWFLKFASACCSTLKYIEIQSCTTVSDALACASSGNGSNGDASGSNGQSNSAQDNSGLSTADLDYANCLSVPSARGRFVPSTDMVS